MTHRQCVEAAHRWVLKNASCGIAFKEMVTLSSSETPDVIGFGAWGHSVLIECKVSRNDFLADKKKALRKEPRLGMGRHRFYACPTGMLQVEDLPEGWGLIYVNEKLKAMCVFNPYRTTPEKRHPGFEQNIKAEHGYMYSALRRLHLRGRIEEIYESPFAEKEAAV